jgi:IS5 family transposase
MKSVPKPAKGVQQPTEPVRAPDSRAFGRHHAQGCPQSGTDRRRKSRQSPAQQRSLKGGAGFRLKRGYGFFRARYLGLAKVELEFLLNAMAFNLKKVVFRVAC